MVKKKQPGSVENTEVSEIPIFPLESIQFLYIPLKSITVNYSQEWAMVGNVGLA